MSETLIAYLDEVMARHRHPYFGTDTDVPRLVEIARVAEEALMVIWGGLALTYESPDETRAREALKAMRRIAEGEKP